MLFRFTSKVDNLPQNAVDKQWRYVGVCLCIVFSEMRFMTAWSFAVEALAVRTVQFRDRNWLLEET